MKRTGSWLFVVLVLLGAGAFVAQRVSGGAAGARPQARVGSGEVRELLVAVPYRLEEPYTHAWRAERPDVSAGWLLVLSVDPERVRPVETAQPVLCAGLETLERYNHGFESGNVIALLPDKDPAGAQAARRLATQVAYFSAPGLPEQTDASVLRRERELALQRGCAPWPQAVVDRALAQGGAAIVARDRVELDRLAAELILKYSPADAARAQELLVPVRR